MKINVFCANNVFYMFKVLTRGDRDRNLTAVKKCIKQ